MKGNLCAWHRVSKLPRSKALSPRVVVDRAWTSPRAVQTFRQAGPGRGPGGGRWRVPAPRRSTAGTEGGFPGSVSRRQWRPNPTLCPLRRQSGRSVAVKTGKQHSGRVHLPLRAFPNTLAFLTPQGLLRWETLVLLFPCFLHGWYFGWISRERRSWWCP